MSAKCSPYMYGAPYIFYFVHPIVKTVEMMVQRVNFEQNLKNIRPATVMDCTTQTPTMSQRLSGIEFGIVFT